METNTLAPPPKPRATARRWSKIILTTAVVLGLVIFVAATLNANKEKMKETAKMVEKSVDVFPVLVQAAKSEALNANFSITGNFEPARELNFASEISGRVVAIYFDKGSAVGEGQLLVKTDDQALQRQLKIAQINYEKRKIDLSRFENLVQANATTLAQYADIKFAYDNAEQQILQLREQIAKTEVKAPISGVISRKITEKGAFLSPGTPIAEIADVSSLKMLVRVAEREALQIRQGQAVKVSTEVYPKVEYTGTVRSIAVKADASKRYEVEIALNNQPQAPLKAGMFGTADFNFTRQGEALMIPRKALMGSLREAYVFVAKEGKAQRRPVKVGIVQSDKVEIVEGLAVGEAVIISGQFNLQDGAKISILK